MTTFRERVYENLRKVPKGKVTTYKELAKAVGTRAYRAVGMAMRTNPYAPEVPCHRVVKTNGELGGFMGKTTGEEIAKKIKMLKEEGVAVNKGKIESFEKILWRF